MVQKRVVRTKISPIPPRISRRVIIKGRTSPISQPRTFKSTVKEGFSGAGKVLKKVVSTPLKAPRTGSVAKNISLPTDIKRRMLRPGNLPKGAADLPRGAVSRI